MNMILVSITRENKTWVKFGKQHPETMRVIFTTNNYKSKLKFNNYLFR